MSCLSSRLACYATIRLLLCGTAMLILTGVSERHGCMLVVVCSSCAPHKKSGLSLQLASHYAQSYALVEHLSL